MIQNITGVVFIIFHIICCVLVWTGINSHLLKVKRYLILPVIFVPVWGTICVLLLHFQIFFHQDKKREIGIEKMKINEEIYRSIIAPKEESDRNIVPLEEVLLIDEADMRRDLIMNILNDDPENYIDMLKQARMNDDVEVVHYAITGMVELSKEYESRLQKIEYRYAKEQENQQLISEYCDFLQEYLSQGLLEGQMELVQRNQYIKLLKKKLKFKEDLHTYVCLTENQMQMKEYEQVLKSLERMDKKWHRNEEYWNQILRGTETGKRTKGNIRADSAGAYLPVGERKGGIGFLAGMIKYLQSFRFKGMTVILGVFLAISVVLWTERSGIQYQADIWTGILL